MISSPASVSGGAGGILLGHEWWLGPLVAGFNLEGGVGGTSVGSNGYLLLFGQAEVNLGISWLSWMQIVAYVGCQAAGNLFPGGSFSAVKMAAPVLGMRVARGGALSRAFSPVAEPFLVMATPGVVQPSPLKAMAPFSPLHGGPLRE